MTYLRAIWVIQNIAATITRHRAPIRVSATSSTSDPTIRTWDASRSNIVIPASRGSQWVPIRPWSKLRSTGSWLIIYLPVSMSLVSPRVLIRWSSNPFMENAKLSSRSCGRESKIAAVKSVSPNSWRSPPPATIQRHPRARCWASRGPEISKLARLFLVYSSLILSSIIRWWRPFILILLVEPPYILFHSHQLLATKLLKILRERYLQKLFRNRNFEFYHL